MKNKFNFLGLRRTLLQAMLMTGSVVAFAWNGPLLAQSAPVPAEIVAQRLSDKVLLVKGPDSNVLVVESDEGLIMVDGGHADWVTSLHQVIATNFPGKQVRALFNTHWHPEQTGSNLLLGEQGVEIIAHENTRLWLDTEIWQRWSGRTFAPLPEAALPVTTFFEDGAIRIGERYVQYGYMSNAHTDGDIWVYFEDEDVLVTGPLVSNGRWPEIDWWTGGYIGGMLDSFVSLLSVPTESTRIVPAYGDIMTLGELKAQNQMYLNIFDRLHASLIKSESLEDILAEQPTAEYNVRMGDAGEFISQAVASFQGHLRDPQNFRLLNIP